MERATTTQLPVAAEQTGRALWHRCVETHPERPFLVHDGDVWTYAEADDQMRRVAAALEAMGVGIGTRVLVGMSNRAETIFVHMALRELGAVLVALVPGLSADQLGYQVDHSEGELLIADEPVASLLIPRLDEFPRVMRTVVDDPAAQASVTARLADLFEPPPIERRALTGADDLSPTAILYTSGSTSTPKGAVLPAGAFFSGGLGYAERFGFTPEDNYLQPMTVAHGLGAMLAQCIPLQRGGRLTITDRFSPSTFWSEVERSQATFTLLFPAQLNLLMKLAPDAPRTTSLRFVISHAWHAAFIDRFGVEMGTVWGSTETGTVGAGSPLGYGGELAAEGYLGPPLPAATEIEARDPSGERVAAGEAGEIWLRHPHIMLEYLKEPALTASTVKDGWLRTGDRGSIDERGYLFFRGRLKSMIKRSGENISLEEIETTLHEHPEVVECVAFGVPDPIRTEELAVAVVLAPGGAGLTAEDVNAYVAARLARWKAPRYVETHSEPLPRLGSGKIDRARIAREFDGKRYWDCDQ